MATFENHRKASNEFQADVADSGRDALTQLGGALKRIGKRLRNDQAVERPREVLTDAIVELAKVHATFRDRALDAVSRAMKIVR
jgi:hypothetical protein